MGDLFWENFEPEPTERTLLAMRELASRVFGLDHTRHTPSEWWTYTTREGQQSLIDAHRQAAAMRAYYAARKAEGKWCPPLTWEELDVWEDVRDATLDATWDDDVLDVLDV